MGTGSMLLASLEKLDLGAEQTKEESDCYPGL